MLLAVGAAAIVGGLFTYALTVPAPLPVGESYSGEAEVRASVFVPAAQWSLADDAIQLSAIVTARIDASASCSVTASNGPMVRTARVSAIADAATMTCGNMSVPVAGADRGEWTVVVTYTTSDFTAESEPIIVEVGA